MLLHISNGFAQSELYTYFFHHLNNLGIDQVVYSAVRTKEEAKYYSSKLDNIEIHVNNILTPKDRIFFRAKTKKTFHDLVNSISIKEITLNHAHTLYSDGAVALNLKKKLGIPFFVSVRSTDFNIFQKYRKDLWFYRNEIISEAEGVFFISPIYKSKFLEVLPSRLKKEIAKKSLVIPNGIADEFFTDKKKNKFIKDEVIHILYVGDFRPLKNVPTLIEAVKLLKEERDVKLTIVGSGGEEEDKVIALVKSNNLSRIVDFKGRVTDKSKLKKLYIEHDLFVMVSKPETFGLVYIEALSQGTPVIFAEGEGIDGYFDSSREYEKVSNVHNAKEIARSIKKLYHKITPETSQSCMNLVDGFDWKTISKKYLHFYSKFL